VTVRSLILGCHNLTGGSSRRRSERLVCCALDLGIRRFDVAPSYGLGTAERTLGQALGSRRRDAGIEITSKFGIPPPSFGAIKAWAREPYRAFRKWSSQGSSSTSLTGASTATGVRLRTKVRFDLMPRNALHRSLRALGVEQLDTFLTHELAYPEFQEDVIAEMMELKAIGAVKRVGFSGDIAAVLSMLAACKTTDQVDVAQVSILELSRLPDMPEVRAFNLSRIAYRILEDSELSQSVADDVGQKNLGAALAATLAWACSTYPSSSFIINASSSTRLKALVEPVATGKLSDWVVVNRTRMARLLGESLAGVRGP
jgi:aryl-alcohol dehydrogenase-like predicted oxidoreductase